MSAFTDFVQQLKGAVEEFRNSFKSTPKVRAVIKVKGRVLEGSYHVFAETKAREHKLKGWMKLRDGLSPNAFIELEVEGPEAQMTEYITDLRRGNRDSSISLVQVEWKASGNPPFSSFKRLL